MEKSEIQTPKEPEIFYGPYQQVDMTTAAKLISNNAKYYNETG